MPLKWKQKGEGTFYNNNHIGKIYSGQVVDLISYEGYIFFTKSQVSKLASVYLLF